MYSTFCTNAASHSRKKPRTGNKYSPIVYALLQSSMGKEKGTTVKVLLNSGASHTIVNKHCVRKLRRNELPQPNEIRLLVHFLLNLKLYLIFNYLN